MTPFPTLTPLPDARRWIDRHPPVPAEPVPLTAASGRILAHPATNHRPPDPRPRAASDGYAVRAADCDGAGAYNPLPLDLQPGADTLPPAAATPVASGWPLPAGADAVLPFEAAEPAGPTRLDVIAPVAPGDGLERWHAALTPTLLEPGRRLGPAEIGLLALCGIGSVQVRRLPRVALVVPGPKSGPDALTPMLDAALRRDGALPQPAPLRDLPPCDAILMAGRTGLGPDDDAVSAITQAGGTLAVHGIAIRPGHTAGLGTIAEIPVLLLPGDPLACLAAYALLARPLLRRLTGHTAEEAHPTALLERKIASELGLAELVPVRLSAGRATPLGTDLGLLAITRADGYVLIPADSEGHPAGSRVEVCMDFRP